jgi:hypothetical protein
VLGETGGVRCERKMAATAIQGFRLGFYEPIEGAWRCLSTSSVETGEAVRLITQR